MPNGLGVGADGAGKWLEDKVAVDARAAHALEALDSGQRLLGDEGSLPVVGHAGVAVLGK